MTTKASKSKAVKPKATKAKVCKCRCSKADLQGLNDYLDGNMSIWALYTYRKLGDQ
jgi:hypothetical protein